MEWLNELQGKIIGLDTAPLIYFIEENPSYLEVTDASLPAVPNQLQLATPVNTCENRMYNTVQTASEPKIPIGISRLGFFAS